MLSYAHPGLGNDRMAYAEVRGVCPYGREWPRAFVCLSHVPRLVPCSLFIVYSQQNDSLKNKCNPTTVLNQIAMKAPKCCWTCVSLIQELKDQWSNLLMSQ